LGESEGSNIEYAIELTEKCQKEYDKFCKKGDKRILNLINESIEQLKTNPTIGDVLIADLKGMRSIHIEKNKYRILYEIHDNPERKITVHKIGPRDDKFYSTGFVRQE